MRNHWLHEKLPTFLRMYEIKEKWTEPIAGISEMSPCVNKRFQFGDRNGHVFELRITQSTDDWQDEFYEWSKQEILETMKSQLLPTDPFDFVIDEGLVKAVLAP